MGEERSDGDERGGWTLGERGSMSARTADGRMAEFEMNDASTMRPCPPMTILLPLAHHGTSSNLSTPS